MRRELTELLPTDLAAQLQWATAANRLSDATTEVRRSNGGVLHLLDLRKARLGESLPALEPGLPSPAEDRWTTSVAVTSGLTVMLALVD